MSADSPNKFQVQDDVYSINLPDEDHSDNLNSEHEQDSVCLALGGLMQLPNLFKSHILSYVAQSNTLDCITLLVGDPVDVENGTLVDTLAQTEATRSPKSEGLATIRKVLQRQVSGKFTQHLVEYFLVFLKISPKDKSAAERGHEASINKCRKYKRSASFDSRKVGLFFSILSIIGTLILIYLTLRVRRIGEAALVPA